MPGLGFVPGRHWEYPEDDDEDVSMAWDARGREGVLTLVGEVAVRSLDASSVACKVFTLTRGWLSTSVTQVGGRASYTALSPDGRSSEGRGDAGGQDNQRREEGLHLRDMGVWVTR